MKKLDLKKQNKGLYNPGAKKVVVVKVPRFNFIMVDGTIPPNMPVGEAPDYQNALETLYGLSYTLKFMLKLREKNPIDYPVMPLEGLWWTKDSHKKFSVSHHDPWYFTAMIMQPKPVTAALFAAARKQLAAKRKPAPAMLGKARRGEDIQLKPPVADRINFIHAADVAEAAVAALTNGALQ